MLGFGIPLDRNDLFFQIGMRFSLKCFKCYCKCLIYRQNRLSSHRTFTTSVTAVPKLPPSAGCGPDERIVLVRAILSFWPSPTFRVKSNGFRLKKEVMDLKIANRGKDYLIEQLQKERNGFSINC